MTILLVVDTETTGFGPSEHLVWQAGAVEIDLSNGRVTSTEFNLPYLASEYPENAYRKAHMYRTLERVTDDIYEATKRYLDDTYSSREDFLEELGARFEQYREAEIDEFSIMYDGADVIVAHNADFDRPFVEQQLLNLSTPPTKPWDCTLKLFQAQFPGQPANLNKACVFFGMDWDVMKEHTALYDAQMCARLLLKLHRIEDIQI